MARETTIALDRRLLGGIALGLLYVVEHGRDPLRLDVRDAWADADAFGQ